MVLLFDCLLFFFLIQFGFTNCLLAKWIGFVSCLLDLVVADGTVSSAVYAANQHNFNRSCTHKQSKKSAINVRRTVTKTTCKTHEINRRISLIGRTDLKIEICDRHIDYLHAKKVSMRWTHSMVHCIYPLFGYSHANWTVANALNGGLCLMQRPGLKISIFFDSHPTTFENWGLEKVPSSTKKSYQIRTIFLNFKSVD